MKNFALLPIVLTLVLIYACSHSNTGGAKQAGNSEFLTGDAEILQSWAGDYPVAQLKRLPQGQHELPIGFIVDANTFENVWQAFNPAEPAPKIDFNANLVIFVRNIQYYNRISIGKVKVENGVAETLAMETMSALPIEEKVAMSLAVIKRKGITGIKSGDNIISVDSAP